MHITARPAAALPAPLLAALWRYRYRVFVETLGWRLGCEPGCERDQFDRADTVHVIAQSDARADAPIVGYARLLPTDRPYLLADVFPQLLGTLPAPASSEIWELSRFAAVDLDARHPGATPAASRFSSAAAVALIDAALKWAAARGARRLITTSPLGVERLLRAAGYHASRAAAPQRIEDDWLFACWIECAPTDERVPALESNAARFTCAA
jgi:N-acyl-L-homoserine lactone synthetase